MSKPIQVKALVTAMERCISARSAEHATTPITYGSATGKNRHDVSENRNTPLDQAALNNLLDVIGGDQSALAELILSFLEEGPKLLDQMSESYARADAEGVRRAAHSMKSSARDFGAVVLAELCRNLENLARSGELSGMAASPAKIRLEFESAEKALRDVLNRIR